jgi:hypothetical protein
MAVNVYFELTREFNTRGPIVALASGQAVVHYRIAIMSRDGDWIVRETPEACARILDVLASRGAWYRPGAPLDVRWLVGGWSSHFEFTDEKSRRVRCDFFSRPPRIAPGSLEALFAHARDPFVVIDLESLIRMKQTQRAKDYAVIGELAARLPPEKEIRLTTDPDRLMRLAPDYGQGLSRPAIVAASSGNRDDVVVALAREQDRRQIADRVRLEAYARAAQPYLAAFSRLPEEERRLPSAHERVCQLADASLPIGVVLEESPHDDVE